MCDEGLLEEFIEAGGIEDENIKSCIAARKIFPCYFGSALKLQGIDELLAGMGELCLEKNYPKDFGARVYKITRDTQGNRLTHMKITGGAPVSYTHLDVYKRQISHCTT